MSPANPNVTAAVTRSEAGRDAGKPPKFLRPYFDRIPAELKLSKNWVLWGAVWNGSKWTKRPIQSLGYGASSTDPKHWSSFEAVRQAYERAEQQGYIELREKDKPPRRVPVGGVGFVFDGEPDENGLVYAGVDFDKVVTDTGIAPDTEARIKTLGSYTERSVSGGGLHVIVKARPLQSGIAHGGVEAYTSRRFFTMTGDVQDGADTIATAPDQFNALVEGLRNQAGRSSTHDTSMARDNVVPFKLPECFLKQKPSAVFADLPADTLAAGLEPDIEEIRAAAAAIPPSAIATEPEWMKVARALAHEAAIDRRSAEQLWEILDAVSRRAPGYNRNDNRQRFDRYIGEALNHQTPITIATLYHMAVEHGWDGLASLRPATLNATPPPTNASRAVPVSSLPAVPPKRQWLHGTDLVRGAVTVLVAPGGRAKSTWLLSCALACASGRDLLGAHVFGGPLRVLCVSTEDGQSEMALRLRAAMTHHGLTDVDVAGLFVIGAEGWGLPLLKAEGNRAVLNMLGVDALAAELDRIDPDVLIIDPLINIMGGVNVNDNAAAALLMRHLASLAVTRRIAIALAHHASKGRDPASAESAMGAASFTNLARIALAIESLDEENAGKIGVPPWDAKSVFRVIGTKQNFAPPNAQDRWFRIVSIAMPNAEPPIYANGDHVAVVEPFRPGASTLAFPVDLVRDALLAVDGANPPLSPSARSTERYAAPLIAGAIARHRGGHASEMDGKAVLDHLMKTDLVDVSEVKIARPGKGTDIRKGLVLTAAGRQAAQRFSQITASTGTPQTPRSPHRPANSLRDDAGGDAPAAPATQGGYGGNAGGSHDTGNVAQAPGD